MVNRFEQVDAPVDDCINVVLAPGAEGAVANILCAKSAHPSLSEDYASESLSPTDALSNAVRFANKLQIPVAIVDSDGLWNKEWGELYRAEDEDAG